MPTTITPTELDRALALRDLSDPDRGPHAMQLVVDSITGALERAWGCPVRAYRAAPVVTVEDNYGVLGYPRDAAAREARYSRYVDAAHMLRAHTTAMVPAALRALADRHDQVVACPGLVYRRDAVDRLHVGEPHQLDLWRARRDRPLTEVHLDEMVELVVAAVLSGAEPSRMGGSGCSDGRVRQRSRPVDHAHTYTRGDPWRSRMAAKRDCQC